MRAWSLIAFMLGGLLCSAPAALCAATLEGSWVWGWYLGAFTDELSGRFDHCGILQRYRGGRSLGFTINQAGWAMGIQDRRWALPLGQRYSLAYAIDGGPLIAAEGEAIGWNLLKIDLAPSADLFEQMKAGQSLHVQWATGAVQFPLTMSAEGLAAMASCLHRYAPAAFENGAAGNPFPSFR